MKKTLFTSLFVLILFVTSVNGQKLYSNAKDKVAEKAAKSLFNELKKLNVKSNMNIVIMPILNYDDEEDKESKKFSNKIEHKLNRLLGAKGIDITIKYFKDDPRAESIMDNSKGAVLKDQDYYDILDALKEVHYLIRGKYEYNLDNNLIKIQNLTIFSNTKRKDAKNERISAEDVEVINNAGPTPIYMSAVLPGWGQIQKGQSKKGWLLLSSEVAIVSSALAFNLLSSQYQDKANSYSTVSKINQQKYIQRSNNMKLATSGAFILAGGVYIFSLADVIVSKRKEDKENDFAFFYVPSVYDVAVQHNVGLRFYLR